MNNLDPEVAEKPPRTRGSIWRHWPRPPPRDWESFDRIVRRPRSNRFLKPERNAVRAVGQAGWHFSEPILMRRGVPNRKFQFWLPALGETLDHSMPSGSARPHDVRADDRGFVDLYWLAGAIVQGTYETFVEVGRRHYGGSLAGKWIWDRGYSAGMGGAQPAWRRPWLAPHLLAVECQPVAHRGHGLKTGYLDRQAQGTR